MNYYGRKGELELTSGYCESNATIDVEKVFLICDSPGAYYYGSGSYRDSARCKYGDKAKMHVYCKLLLRCGYVPGATPLNWFQFFSSISLVFQHAKTVSVNEYTQDGIALTIESGVLNILTTVQEPKDLCYYKRLTSSSTNSCPGPGNYHLQTYFTLPLVWEDKQLQYTPDIRLQFFSLTDNSLIGCASTGTVATITHAHLKSKSGEWALGVALLVVGLAFAFLLFLSYRRKKRLEKIREEMNLGPNYHHFVHQQRQHGYNKDPLEDQYVEFRTKR